MTAKVTRESAGRFIAYCEQCQEGMGRVTRVANAAKWALDHNERKHEWTA